MVRSKKEKKKEQKMKEEKMQGSMSFKTVVTNSYVDKCVFRWFIYQYDSLKVGRLYYQVFAKYGFTYVYKLIKSEGNLHIAFQCNYLNARGRYVVLDGNCSRDEIQTEELLDGLYVGTFPESIILNKNRTYVENGMIVIGFRFITNCSTTIQYHRPFEIGLQSDTDELSHDIQSMFINSENSDFTLKLDNGSIKAHKSVLYARSNFFKEFFSFDEKATQFSIDDISVQTMYNVLLYVYGAELRDTRIENMLKLLKIAYLLKISSLKERCLDYFEETDSWKAIEDLEFFEYEIEDE